MLAGILMRRYEETVITVMTNLKGDSSCPFSGIIPPPLPPPVHALVFNDLWISLHVYKAYLSLRYKGIYKNLPTIFFLP